MAERVFCKDCKHRLLYRPSMYGVHWYIADGEQCGADPAIVPHPIHGDQRHYVLCELRNAEFSCALFEAGEQPHPWPMPESNPCLMPSLEPTVVKKPWWRFWS